ncbi:nucleoside triphosphate pyrophosphohydrolase [Pseudobdellovibrio exovorus]|uniref:Tetrapyrrole methylase family protein/MazG family protein n=1 Tax=Pseudobdellovibrio exovorus JSS TaxID=1184267 RepID=M4V9K0_9BACT|nr:nucleoside triphosphate pyrophosphohydrolase [Pseudobdellovibrio exovorus]AGH95120.1 tetrapyrrole methylase family protein/MazG family protein [Pseudobdellovibrio exovorus JSS]
MPQPPKTLNTFESLLQVIADLRGPDGCPWDKQQSHQSLARYAIEEVHELVEALESATDPHICEELGDVLFQVILHAQLAKERQAFDISNVIESIASKIVRRHPHVFSDVKVQDAKEVISNWQEIKKAEKKNKPKKESSFDIPPSLPALQRAYSIGDKTQKYQFDWSNARQVLQQLRAEIVELEEALEDATAEQQKNIEHELGDVLFSAAQVARHLQVDPESALREANRRFIQRFENMVHQKNGLEAFIATSPEEKEQLWKKAKQTVSK